MLTGTKAVIPCSYVGPLLFLMSIIARFPLRIILLVVTEKYYFLSFPWKMERVAVILSKTAFSFFKVDGKDSA